MAETIARAAFRIRLIQEAESDPRIAGMVDYGSSITGRLDEWSDIDVAIFIRDSDYDAFSLDWRNWADRLGDPLLAYISFVGHPWLVYDADPIPLRIDLDLCRESQIGEILGWGVSPVSAEAMVWYDGTGGRLQDCVRQLVGKSLRPHDLKAAFDQACGDLWYHLLYCYCKLNRGEQWIARQAFHSRTLEPLIHLLRLEAAAVDQWVDNPAAVNVERTLAPDRQIRLEACIPEAGSEAIMQALRTTAQLGYEVCMTVAEQRGWAWPRELADRTVRLVHR